MSICERLKTARKSASLTQKQVAEHIGMTPNNYQKYELGSLEPNLKTLVKIADLFNVSTDYLLCRDSFLSKSADALQINPPAHPSNE